jgi:glycosyltransferase involved in cell wall biosynthesis
MPSTKVLLADAGSTDGTPDIARSFDDRLNVEVIPGGLPAVGRNNGARRASTPYVLFIDADIELDDPTLVRRSVELARRKKLHCVTTNIHCPQGRGIDRALYAASNLAQQLSRLCRPFSTGMYMLFDRARFNELGGFHEGALYAEDYLLSKKVARRRFGIVRGHIVTTNRRFKNMGYMRVARLFLTTALNTWNDNFFLRDHRYWRSEPRTFTGV